MKRRVTSFLDIPVKVIDIDIRAKVSDIKRGVFRGHSPEDHVDLSDSVDFTASFLIHAKLSSGDDMTRISVDQSSCEYVDIKSISSQSPDVDELRSLLHNALSTYHLTDPGTGIRIRFKHEYEPIHLPGSNYRLGKVKRWKNKQKLRK